MYPSHLVLIDPLKNIALKRQQYVGEFIGCYTSVSKPKFVDEPLIEDLIFDSEDENKTEFKSKQRKLSFAKIEFVESNEHVKTPRESIKKVGNKKQAKYPRKNSQSPK
ncbi:hypothetical protein Tco_0179751, partial [Tanacetum coccineum]